MKIIAFILMMLVSTQAQAASIKDLPQTLESTIRQLQSLKDAAEDVVRAVKMDIHSGALPSNEGPVIRLAYTNAAKAVDGVIDDIIKQINDLPQVITPTKYQVKVNLLNAEKDQFIKIVQIVYDRNKVSTESEKVEGVLATLATIAVVIAIIDFVDSRITRSKIKNYIKTELDNVRWNWYQGIIINIL